MAEEIGFENGRNSNFQRLVTLTLTLGPAIRHTVVHHSSTSTYIPNFIEIEETFCGRTDGRTDGHFPPLILLGRLSEVDLKTQLSPSRLGITVHSRLCSCPKAKIGGKLTSTVSCGMKAIAIIITRSTQRAQTFAKAGHLIYIKYTAFVIGLIYVVCLVCFTIIVFTIVFYASVFSVFLRMFLVFFCVVLFFLSAAFCLFICLSCSCTGHVA